MERYICIHGHFYQPPRENPWLEAIELQDSAYPFHDWNERITVECYRANGASRMVDDRNRIIRISNNYARINFNFGPTLLSWLEEKAPMVYQAILAADRESQQLFSGHGSAMAQVYNHLIMPLANTRDKHTQVIWGIRDFEYRFGRKPEGMWLAETAVDIETLEVLAEHGIRFTILAQYQAARFRRIGDHHWNETAGGIDPTTSYVQHLPYGRSIAIFFYDGPISQAVAFEKLLSAGEKLANRLLGAFYDGRPWPQLVHIATDGETYGHHHSFGEMALTYALQYIEQQGVRLTNYGEYLERHPPQHEVQIAENTSWSCYHGVERWRSGRGSNTGLNPHWNQEWRAPLRESMDWLRDAITPHYEQLARQFLKDPWAARNDYINVVLDRSPEALNPFLNNHVHHQAQNNLQRPPISDHDMTTILKLMELQRHAMLMYTSCGWFFDELSGIETIQIIQYAGRVIQLAQELFNVDLEQTYLDILGRAHSNKPEEGNGRQIYERYVRPSTVELQQVCAHYAITSVFEVYPKRARIFCYSIEREDHHYLEAGKIKLMVGKAWIASDITHESMIFTYGVLHFGDHNLSCGVRPFQGEEQYLVLVNDATDALSRADLTAAIRLFDRHFLNLTYSLKSLFRDEQRKVLNLVLTSTLERAEAVYRQLYDQHVPLMRFLNDLGIPTPRAFHTAAELALNSYLRQSFEFGDAPPDIDRINLLIEEAKAEAIALDGTTLGFTLSKNIEQLVQQLSETPEQDQLLEQIVDILHMVKTLPFTIDLWYPQNLYYDMLQTTYPEIRSRADQGNPTAQTWIRHFNTLGEQLGLNLAEIAIQR